ncbi:hypothetical protein [Streptomyces virginiae]|uniref:hypothetical protein n=1 Tax=Streptomyces virginiae TaxID=1961 RepID=UPI0036FEBA8A
MSEDKQENPTGPEVHDPSAMWRALTRLHATHPEAPDRFLPFLRPEVLLSLTRLELLWRVRVELAGGETMADLHWPEQTFRSHPDARIMLSFPGIGRMLGQLHHCLLARLPFDEAVAFPPAAVAG